MYSLHPSQFSSRILFFSFQCLMSEKDDVVAIGSDLPTITLHSVSSGELLASLGGHSNRVKGLALSPDNQLLFSASSDGTIRTWAFNKSLVCVCVCVLRGDFIKLFLRPLSPTESLQVCEQHGQWLQTHLHHSTLAWRSLTNRDHHSKPQKC